MGFFAWFTRTSLKFGAVAAAFKVSIDNDVWTLNSETGEKVYGKLTKNITPGAIVYKEKLPQSDEIKTDVGSKWNGFVNCAFRFLNNAPELANEKINSIYKSADATKVVP